jgi:hypothetical protein
MEDNDMREIYDVIIACESMAAELLAGLPELERETKANAFEALKDSAAISLIEKAVNSKNYEADT